MTTPPTLDCETVIRLVFAYLDGELGEAEHRHLAAHLEQCRSCFSRAEFERRLQVHLTALGVEPVPPPFAERVRALIDQLGSR